MRAAVISSGLVVTSFRVVKEVVPDVLDEDVLTLLSGVRNGSFDDLD